MIQLRKNMLERLGNNNLFTKTKAYRTFPSQLINGKIISYLDKGKFNVIARVLYGPTIFVAFKDQSCLLNIG